MQVRGAAGGVASSGEPIDVASDESGVGNEDDDDDEDGGHDSDEDEDVEEVGGRRVRSADGRWIRVGVNGGELMRLDGRVVELPAPAVPHGSAAGSSSSSSSGAAGGGSAARLSRPPSAFVSRHMSEGAENEFNPHDLVLPSASTCSHLLKVPDYSTIMVLREKLNEAVVGSAGLIDLS